MNNTFPKKLHLRSKAQFSYVFNNNKKISNKAIAIFFCKNKLSYARLGIIVSKKNVATATQRNKYKRIIRESFRIHQYLLQGLDIVVFIYKGIENLTNSEINLCLEKQWQKLVGYLAK